MLRIAVNLVSIAVKAVRDRCELGLMLSQTKCLHFVRMVGTSVKTGVNMARTAVKVI